MRKMKKEREKKDRELHALPKLKMNEDVTVTKDEHVRSIQLKGNNHFGQKNILVAMEDLGFAQRKVLGICFITYLRRFKPSFIPFMCSSNKKLEIICNTSV